MKGLVVHQFSPERNSLEGKKMGEEGRAQDTYLSA